MFIVPITELIFTGLPRAKAQGQTLKMFTTLPLLVEMQIFRFEPYDLNAKRRRIEQFVPKLKKDQKTIKIICQIIEDRVILIVLFHTGKKVRWLQLQVRDNSQLRHRGFITL
jgi:hypothetical protein